MAGLGIDFGSLGEPAVPAAPQSAPRSTRRHAHLSRARTTSRTHGERAKARLPCAPLRENRSVTNTHYDKPLASAPVQHLLPPKPTACIVSPAQEDVQHAHVMLRADTPSDGASPRSDISVHGVQKALTPLTITHAETAAPFLPAALQWQEPRVAPELPSKPQTTPMLPLERDERVGIEIFLEEKTAVEGGCLQGCIRLQLPKHTSPDTAMLLAQPRVRLIGFETLPGEDVRHVFYHHASVIDGDRSVDGPSEPYVLHGSPAVSQPEGTVRPQLPCYASLPDADGFYLGKEGTHVLPFTLQLPIARGVKGSYRSENAEVGYIAIASVRVRSFAEQQGGIAHCFQKIQLYPYLNPTEVLASAVRPIVEQAVHTTPNGESVRLAAALHRETWVAGQRVYFDMSVLNRMRDTMHHLHVSLLCTETLYRARGDASDGDYSAASSTRTLLQETLDASTDRPAGHWWSGVRPGSPVHFGHSVVLPSDALTIDKSRHVEVYYTLRLGVGSGASPIVLVELPVRIVHFVSLDPPPMKRSFAGAGLLDHALGMVPDQGQMVERVRSMEALRSPRAFMSASGHLLPSPAAAAPPTARAAQHHRSLDFINSAIRSATARRSSPYAPSVTETPPAGLGIELGSQMAPSIRPRASWYHDRRRNDLSLSGDSEALRPPMEDTSLELGDETNDDVVLVFDHTKAPAKPRPDTTVDTEGGSTMCHDILNAYGDSSHDTSTTISFVLPAQSSTPRKAATPPPDVGAADAPHTPTRPKPPTSVPRDASRTRSAFTFATSSSPLKVKTGAKPTRPVTPLQGPTLSRARSATSLHTAMARAGRGPLADARSSVPHTPERPARISTPQTDALVRSAPRAPRARTSVWTS